MKKILILIAMATLSSFSALSSAESRWVADSMYLPMRSGQGSQYRIIANLKTGTQLTVVSESEDGDWTEVKTGSGKTGFVRSQYLLNTPTAAQRLTTVQQQLDKLTKDYQLLKNQLSSTQSNGSQLSEDLIESQAEAEKLQNELDELQSISQNAVTLHESHKELLHNYELIQTELDVLKAKNSRLQNDSRNTFFLYGAGSVLLGVMIALLAPHMRRRRGFSEWAN